MCTKMLLTPLAMLLFSVAAIAQQPVTVTDTTPVVINGLQMGFTILNTSLKEVGNKGDFSRYSVRFYVTNTTGEAKIMMFRPGIIPGSDISPDIVHFYCANATGARLTSNSAILRAQPCNVMALVDDRDCVANKLNRNRRIVQIGYWLRPGETVNADEIIIVPLNQYPQMTLTPVFMNNGGMATTVNNNSNEAQPAAIVKNK